MEPVVVQIERIAREVIEQSTRAGENGGTSGVERLVDEVLARIKAIGTNGDARAVAGGEAGRKLAGGDEKAMSARRCPGGSEPPGHRQGSAPATALELQARVVTLADVAGRLDGIQHVILPPRAVITPAARDELKLRDIAISYAIESRGAAKPLRAVVWGQAESDYNAARLIDALSREGITIEQAARTGLVQVSHELSDEIIKGGKPAVLLTAKAAAAVCLANRRRGVRAVMAQSVATTMQAVRAVGTNLLVVDPAGAGWFELKRLIAQFIAGAPYPCPAEYREQLG